MLRRLRPFKHWRSQAHFALWAELTGLLTGGADQLRYGGGRGQLVFRTHIGQCAVQGAIQEVVHRAPLAEAHFVLGRVHIDVDAVGFQLQEQHECGVPTIEQHVTVGLAHSVGNQLVAHRTAIDEEVLQVCLAAREGRQANPAP